MARRNLALISIEAAAIVAWLALAAVFVGGRDGDGEMVPLDASALTLTEGSERWNGIFFQDQHVGYSVERSSPTTDGGTLYEQRSQLRVATFGRIQKIVTAGAALVDGEGHLNRFDFFMAADQVRLVARGEVRPADHEIRIEVRQGGETSTMRFPISRPPQVSLSLSDAIRRTELSVGKRFSVPYFDPVTLSDGEMQMEVTDVVLLENGEEAYWLTSRFGDLETRSLVTPAGETLRQEGALGLSVVRMSAEDAQDVPTTEEPVDLIALSAVTFKGRLEEPRSLRLLAVRVGGVELARLPQTPPLQTVDGDLIRVDVPLLEELPALPVAADPSAPDTDPQWLEATSTLPAAHPDLRAKAAEVVGDAADRVEATRRLVDFVFRYVEKVPTMGVPNGLEVLRTASGDCNEHTALFVSLARAAGIPARIAAGVVYSDRVGERGAFYYHAWPEVALGGPSGWVPVDPTFGEFPADATHIKLVEGDLDRQVEIMGYLGKLSLSLVEAR